MNAQHLIISKYCSLCKNKVKTKDDISIIKLSTRRLQEITLPFGFYPSVIIIMIMIIIIIILIIMIIIIIIIIIRVSMWGKRKGLAVWISLCKI